MKKSILIFACTLYFGSVLYAVAAPTSTLLRNTLPETTQTYDLGSTTPAAEWNNIFTKNITVSGTCTGCSTLTGGTAGMLTSWLTSSSLTATGTPTFASFVATSTATSTAAGGISTAGLSSSNGLTITGGGVILPSRSISDAALSTNIPLLNGSGQTFSGVGTTTFSGNLSALNIANTSVSNALVLAGAGGYETAYTGTSCTNQFPRSISATGVATCATVANTDLANSSLTVTAGSGLIGGGSVALGSSITLTAQVGTSSVPTIGSLAYWTSAGTPSLLGTVATTSLTATSPLSLSQPISVIGSSASSLTCSTCVTTSRQLTIAGTANQITSSAGAQDLSGDRTWTLSIPSLFSITQASTTQLTVTGNTYLATASGNVGIGTTSPWGLFSIQKSSGDSNAVIANTSSGNDTILTFDNQNNGGGTESLIKFSSGGVLKGQIRYDFNDSVADTMNFYTAGTARLSFNANGLAINNGITAPTSGNGLIVASGNVGIGTTSPTAKLGIGGTGTLLELLNTAGSMIMRVVSETVTLLGTWDFTGATTKLAGQDKSGLMASSTLSYIGSYGASGTTTTNVLNPSRPVIITDVNCKSDSGNNLLVVGSGTSTSTPIFCNAVGQSAASQSISIATRGNVLVAVGTASSTMPNTTTFTITYKNND